MYRVAASVTGITLLHVRAHTGNPWNELADRIAALPLSGALAPRADPVLPIARTVRADPAYVRWATMLVDGSVRRLGIPLVGSALVVSPSEPPSLPPFCAPEPRSAP